MSFSREFGNNNLLNTTQKNFTPKNIFSKTFTNQPNIKNSTTYDIFNENNKLIESHDTSNLNQTMGQTNLFKTKKKNSFNKPKPINQIRKSQEKVEEVKQQLQFNKRVTNNIKKN